MEPLRMSTLSEVRDGKLAAVFDAAMVQIHHDCVERPLLGAKRKVTLEITMLPTLEDPLEAADIDFIVKVSVPGTSIGQRMKSLRGRNCFGFEPDTTSIDHAENQPRLDGIDD